MRYDIAVIGNDEAAFEMLCVSSAARLKTVAVLPESRHSAWLMSQALRRVVSGLLVDQSRARRELLQRTGSPKLLQRLVAGAVADEVREHIRLLERLGVDVRLGEARFGTRREVTVASGTDLSRTRIQATSVVIATGVRQTGLHRPLGLMPCQRPESVFEGTRLPRQLCIVGGGDLGAGLAGLLSLFGVQTKLLTRADDTSALQMLAATAGVQIGQHPTELGLPQNVTLAPAAEGILDCRRSVGFTEHLNLSAIGVEPDENGQLWCASHLETWCSGVFGLGDVVGFTPDAAVSPSRQADRVLNRITHRIPRPHFLRTPVRRTAMV